MAAKSDLMTFDTMTKGLFCDPRSMPQWAKDAWAARAEIGRTGKRIAVPEHHDNTGAYCRNVGSATLADDVEHHDCCHFCNDLGEAANGTESTR